MLTDLTFALRRLRSAPGTVIFAVVTLALGMGVTTATYSIVYSSLWRPLGIADQDNVVLISRSNMMRPGPSIVSPEDFDAIRAAAPSLGASSVAAWSTQAGTLLGHGQAQMGSVEFVTGAYFTVLGITPRVGRFLEPSDDVEGAAPVMVLSEAAWRTQFESDPNVVGQTIKVAGVPYTIVGVTPQGFRGVHIQGFTYGHGWIPMSQAAPILRAQNWRSARPTSLTVGVRLAAGHTTKMFQAELSKLEAQLNISAPVPPLQVKGQPPIPLARYWTTALVTDDANVDQSSEMGRLLIALPGLVLLIACTNIANLVLSRGASRRQDFGVRRALGASRWQLIREQLVEQGLIAIAGGLAATYLAYRLVDAARHVSETLLGPFTSGVPIDWHISGGILPATCAAVLAALVVSGVIPALHLTRDSLRTVLAQGDPTSTPRWRGRGNLIALQLGISVGLFLIAIVFVRMMLNQDTFSKARTLNVTPEPAFAQLAIASVPFETQGQDDAAISAYAVKTIARAKAAGVTAAVTSEPALLSGVRSPVRTLFSNYVHAEIVGASRSRVEPNLFVSLAAVSPAYFEVTGTPLSAGRAFAEADPATAVILNQRLATRLFGATNPVGQHLPVRVVNDRRHVDAAIDATVVGVAADTSGTKDQDALFVPFQHYTCDRVTFIAHSPAGAPVETLRAALANADPQVAVAFVSTGELLVSAPWAFLADIAMSLAALALLALAMATVGLYGVLSHVFARRTREMGIRVALGATPRAITTLVLRDGFRPILEGLFIGLATATVIRFFMMRTMSDRVVPIDPVECIVCGVLLSAAGAVACWLPARRAATVAPNVALRSL